MASGYRDKVLILSKKGTSIKSFLKDLFNTNPKTNGETWDEEEFQSGILKFGLDTKYYTKDITFWIDQWEGNSLDSIILEGYRDVASHLAGLIFVSEQEEAKNSLTELRRFNSALDNAEILVKLFIILKKRDGGEKIENNWMDEDIDWLYDNEVELLDFNDLPEYGELEEGVTYGIDRAFEALCATEWDGIELKNQNNLNKEVQVNNEFRNLSDILDYEDKSNLPSMKEISNFSDLLFPEDTFEGFDFSRSIDMIKSLREKSSQLNDSERRKLAAKVALSFGLKMGELDENYQDL